MTNNGGPAFPQTEFFDERPIGAISGMTLRDYFAAKAMPSILAYMLSDAYDGGSPFQDATNDAYRIADYMLKERAK